MKKTNFSFLVVFVCLFIQVQTTLSQTIPPVSKPVCAYCDADILSGAAHQPSCPYYVAPTSSSGTTTETKNTFTIDPSNVDNGKAFFTPNESLETENWGEDQKRKQDAFGKELPTTVLTGDLNYDLEYSKRMDLVNNNQAQEAKGRGTSKNPIIDPKKIQTAYLPHKPKMLGTPPPVPTSAIVEKKIEEKPSWFEVALDVAELSGSVYLDKNVSQTLFKGVKLSGFAVTTLLSLNKNLYKELYKCYENQCTSTTEIWSNTLQATAVDFIGGKATEKVASLAIKPLISISKTANLTGKQVASDYGNLKSAADAGINAGTLIYDATKQKN